VELDSRLARHHLHDHIGRPANAAPANINARVRGTRLPNRMRREYGFAGSAKSALTKPSCAATHVKAQQRQDQHST